MRIYLKNSPAKFHHDPIWNEGALGFFEDVHPKKKKNNNNKMSSDMRSVPDLKIADTASSRAALNEVIRWDEYD